MGAHLRTHRLAGILFTVALGLSFAWLTRKRGSVWSAVVAHSMLNLCIEPGLLNKAMAMKLH